MTSTSPLNLKAENAKPFDIGPKREGNPTYGMYATLALKKIGLCEQTRKTLVEPHWVGITTVQAENGEEIVWTPQGADVFEFEALPANLDELILIRPGLVPTPFTTFATVQPGFHPIWWDDWKERSGGAEKAVPQGGQLFAWDLGAGLTPLLPETSVVARAADGREETVFFEWHIIPQAKYDVLLKARLENGPSIGDDARKAAADFIQATMTSSQWFWRLAGAAWIRGVEPCPQRPEDSLELSFRLHLAMPAGGEFVAARFGWWLSHALSAAGVTAEGVQLRLLTYSHEIFRTGQFTVTKNRDLRIWPPPVIVEEPLRPTLVLDETAISRWNALEARLAELKELDEKLSVFASSHHKYRLNAPLTERALQNIENKHKVIFPDEYRTFLLRLGNGGAGPAYGIESLQDSLKQSHTTLSEPFPHREAYLPVYGEDEDLEEITEVAEWDEFSDVLFSDPEASGALVITSFGCGMEVLLIITGEERGNLWWDDRSSDQGIQPLCRKSDGGRLGFLEWYESWLEGSFAKLADNH